MVKKTLLDVLIALKFKSTTEVADKLEIGRSYLWEIRTGKKNPSKKTIRHIENLFQIPWDELNKEIIIDNIVKYVEEL
jgi:transcriptional regulator with XRE-family HTH domain